MKLNVFIQIMLTRNSLRPLRAGFTGAASPVVDVVVVVVVVVYLRGSVCAEYPIRMPASSSPDAGGAARLPSGVRRRLSVPIEWPLDRVGGFESRSVSPKKRKCFDEIFAGARFSWDTPPFGR